MKKIWIFIIGFVAGILATILVAFLFFLEPIDDRIMIEQISYETEFGRLQNTRWYYHNSDWKGNNVISISETIEFGNGNYLFSSKTDRNSSNQETKTEIGTFRVSGDNVTLTSSDGKEKTGIIIGSSLTIDGRTYR